MPNVTKRLIRDCRGASAVEFAFIAPMMLTLVFGIVAYGTIISINNGLQQIVAEAARASVAGLTDAERTQLAQASVTANVSAYAFIDSSKMSVSFNDPTPSSFQVSIRYDMSNTMAYHLLTWLPLPPAAVTRNAVVQRGGF
ncbi:MAG: TadE/TadG family type IV pilus assembly protein [Janthinobacterium lividum]